MPGVSPAAKQMGRWAAANLIRRLKGEPTRPFRYIDYGNLAAIGRKAAIVELPVPGLGALRLSGFPAWLFWLFAHIYFLIGFRNRLIVMVDWAWAYFTYERSPASSPNRPRSPGRRRADSGSRSAVSAPHQPDTLQLVGEPRLLHADGTSGALEPKDALLLAYLALEGPTPRRVLAALLWPDVDAERARANLRQRLFRLRRALGRDLLEGGEVAGLCADLEVRPRRAATRPPPAACCRAWTRPTPAGWPTGWREAARSGAATARLRALAERIDRGSKPTGRLAAALAAAEQLVDADPTSEHGHRRLMRLHYLRGDRAAALAAFDRCCDALQRILGVAPDAETEALRARVEAGTRRTRAAPAATVAGQRLRPPRLIGREAEWQALRGGLGGGHGRAWSAARPVSARPAWSATSPAPGHGALIVDARPGDARVPHALLSRLLRQLLAAHRATAGSTASRDELAHLLPELGRDRRREPRARADALHQRDRVGCCARRLAEGAGRDWCSTTCSSPTRPASRSLQQLADGRHRPALDRRLPARRADSGGQRSTTSCSARTARGLCLLQPLADAADRRPDRFARRRGARGGAARAGPGPAQRRQSAVPARDDEAAADAAGADTAVEPVRARLPTAGSVSRLIGRRLGRLSPAAVRLARCAAIAGPDFSPELAAHVLGLRALDLVDAWAELDAAQVLRDGAFAHDLILEAARDSVPAPIARRLHVEMAGFLEAAAPSRPGWRSTGSTAARR